MRKAIVSAALAVAVFPLPSPLWAQPPITWTLDQPAGESYITGGPWTLEQSDASQAARAAGYCVSGVQQSNPGTERVQPYYFPYVTGSNNNLQGIFDYRPRNIDEATVAAVSNDGGRTWQFQQEVLELTDQCPPSDTKDLNNDNGLGHPFLMTIGGSTFLYHLDRRDGHIDSDGLVVTTLNPQPGLPLNGAPEEDPGGDDLVTPGAIETPGVYTKTVGLLNPDAIIGEVLGSFPRTILYIQKQRGADLDPANHFTAAQLCLNNPAYTPPLTSTNDDITTPRMAQTTDGINFMDLGPLTGLNDPTIVSPTGTRWIGSGSLIQLAGGRHGLFFSGGTCVDADSDSFHYIGYAESNDLVHWNVINGIDNPIASTASFTVTYQGNSVTVPSTPPVIGNTQGWFEGRVYGPNAIVNKKSHTVTIVFAGYHTPKPKNDLGDYRTIGWVSIAPSHPGQVGEGDQ